MDWFLAGIMLYANFILIKDKTWKAFALMGLGNLGYSLYWFSKQEWATMLLVSAFLAQNVWGIFKWYTEEKNENRI
jgi:hypothetical protein